MRILIFHGYLLHGTGSNVYNARLAEALVSAGHEVHLLCQDRDPVGFDWVDATGDWDGGRLKVRGRREPARATVYRPDIAGLLPVYVADRYEGVDARPFPELTGAELDRYLELNVAAVREVCGRARPDAALANHLVMGPAIVSRALAGSGVPYAVKVHGSALEYTVKPHPRFLPYAREGLAGAAAVLVGSRHTAESLWAAVGDRELPERTRLGPPGVDVGEFRPRSRSDAIAGLQSLVRRLGRADGVEPEPGAEPAHAESGAAIEPAHTAWGRPVDPPGAHSFARSATDAGSALSQIGPGDRLVVFVGKLIASKGPELLLAAWPLVQRRHPDARLVMVGFGAWREDVERWAAALAAGELEAARSLRGEDGRELPELAAFLDGLADPGGYVEAARATAGRVLWPGRLDHDELADLLPAAEALVAPSTFPEAFGMVAAEGAACGALPVVARHSGLAEVSQALAAAVPEPARAWLSFEVGPGAVEELAACLDGWLSAGSDLRSATRRAIVEVTRERWSWDGVARTVVAAASGDVSRLPVP